MDMWVIGIGLFVIVVVLRLYMASRQGKVNAQIRENPVGGAVIQAIESVGRYDGSSESKRKAQSEMDDEAKQIGSFEQHTIQLYWNTLEETDLYILLALWYSITVGHYLNGLPPQMVADLRAGVKNIEAKNNAAAMAAFFPSYSSFVKQRHSNTDYFVILGISSNFMDAYLQRRNPELYMEMMYQ